MEVPFDTIRTTTGPSITRPNWHDVIPGLGHSSNQPPDRPTSVSRGSHSAHYLMPRSSFRSIAAFIVMACQVASTWSSVSGRRVGYCERVLSRFSELSENSMLNVKEVSKCFWENEGI